MSSSTKDPEVVRVSPKGQTTIPKNLREKFGIETPGEVFIYEGRDGIVIEPVPSGEDLHGIHSGDHERGEIAERVREIKEGEREREEENVERLRPSDGDD
ncbi:MAG: AbrB/MazE/SpoVT family DNA-binding domain-containing protein [Halobacteria archaeon]|nr:AbrB/MazE/SpoVT family DNA-binding domain-containing protein [Halobacteria archaeon]